MFAELHSQKLLENGFQVTLLEQESSDLYLNVTIVLSREGESIKS